MGLGMCDGLPLTGLLEVLVDWILRGDTTGSLLLVLPLVVSMDFPGEGSLEGTYRMVDSSRKPLPLKGLTLPLGETSLESGGGFSSCRMTKAVFSLRLTGGATLCGCGARGGAGRSGDSGGRTLKASGIMILCRFILALLYLVGFHQACALWTKGDVITTFPQQTIDPASHSCNQTKQVLRHRLTSSPYVKHNHSRQR